MNIYFSKIELQHLFRAWLLLSLAFAIAAFGISFSGAFLFAILISGFTVGLGFLFHELAHKFVAQKFGCLAEFRANMQMLFLAVLISFTGFIFAAPGAVLIRGHLTKKTNGIVSASGPAANLLVALAFFAVYLMNIPLVSMVSRYGFIINTWLGLFNLLPFGGFDGTKILHWSKPVYFIMASIAALMLILINLF